MYARVYKVVGTFHLRVWEKGAALLALFALLGPIHKDIDV